MIVGLLSIVSCGGGKADDTAVIEDTIGGYVTTFNAEDFIQCLTYFTDYEDKEDALAFLSFMRSLSGKLELKKIEDIAISPPAVLRSGQTATASVTFTITGEESTDQMQLKKVDGLWKIIWEQEQSVGAYQLTHSSEDAEYILNWDSIISRCPDIGGYDRLEAFIYRGESKQFSTGDTFTLDMNSPVAWSSVRFVRTEPVGAKFRSFGVWIMYFETDEELDEYLQMDDIRYGMMQGVTIQREGDFATAVVENETPLQAVQLLLAGKHFAIMLMEYATPDESLFFSKDALTEMLSIARGNITSMEITPLPTSIPGRSSQ